MISFAAALYRKLVIYGSYLAPVALLLLRLGWGWELIESGWGHLHHVDDMVSRFESWGITFQPRAQVYMSASMELLGGVLLMLGLGARLISIPLIVNFIVAFLTASKDNVHKIFQQDISNIIDDAAYPFLITSIIILAFGPGLFSVDAILQRTVFKRYSSGLK
jgi:putative oxidoreductase